MKVTSKNTEYELLKNMRTTNETRTIEKAIPAI